MKKLKLMPSILMLVACVAVLGVGVFAVAPTKNTISGSITINSANPEVLISAYGHKADGSLDESNVIMAETPARSGVNINLGNLNFDTSSANDEEDLAKLDIKVTIRVSNPSSTKLGVYFSKSPVADKATTDDIAEEKDLTDSTTAKDNVKAVMEGYKALNAKATDNGVCDTTITFKLLKFVTADQNPTINLSDNANKLYLNIEEFNGDLQVSEEELYYKSLGFTTIGKGKTILTSEDTSDASGKIVIADSVTEIAVNAFYERPITAVLIPNGVQKIGYQAFAYIENLKAVYMPSSATELEYNIFLMSGDLTPGEYSEEFGGWYNSSLNENSFKIYFESNTYPQIPEGPFVESWDTFCASDGDVHYYDEAILNQHYFLGASIDSFLTFCQTF